jgi:hypothetical protein
MKDCNEKRGANDDYDPVASFQLGVWEILTLKDKPFDFRAWKELFSSAIPLIWQLCSEIYCLAPTLFFFFILTKIWAGVESELRLHLSSRLLRIVSPLRRLYMRHPSANPVI